MREYFKFYRNFYEAIENLGEKSQLLLYKSVMKLYFNRCKNVTELDQLCAEIETKLEQKRNVFGTFLALKPLIMKSAKAYLQEGLKDKEQDSKNEVTPRGLINNKEKRINKNNNKGVTPDPYLNDTKTFFVNEYKKVFGCVPILTRYDCENLAQLSIDVDNLKEHIPKALHKLKEIKFEDINFKPSANWLLKDNNFARVLNGEFKQSNGNRFTDISDFESTNSIRERSSFDDTR